MRPRGGCARGSERGPAARPPRAVRAQEAPRGWTPEERWNPGVGMWRLTVLTERKLAAGQRSDRAGEPSDAKETLPAEDGHLGADTWSRGVRSGRSLQGTPARAWGGEHQVPPQR